jgi:hypothetical protein
LDEAGSVGPALGHSVPGNGGGEGPTAAIEFKS